jgi:hypothetical protein
LKREAGHEQPPVARIADSPLVDTNGDEQKLLNSIGRLLHTDDERRLTFLQAALANEEPPDLNILAVDQRRMLEGFMLTIWSDEEHELQRAMRRVWKQRAARNELLELLGILDERATHRTFPLADEMVDERKSIFRDVPLQVHARYTRDEVLAAIGRATLAAPFSHREGPLWHLATKTDYFFITLEKSEKYYSPSTRYRDYAVSPEIFHWESQSQTPENSPTGQRYINHEARGSNVMLLVRPRNKDSAGKTVPFTFLGPATYMEHKGERPMAILWKLRRAMPLDFFSLAKVAAG